MYKGGGNGWWINTLSRWIRTLPRKVWVLLAFVVVLMRVKAVQSRVDKEWGRYRPYERKLLDVIGRAKDTVGASGIFKPE